MLEAKGLWLRELAHWGHGNTGGQSAGAVEIIATDLSDYRLKLASDVGADVVINVKEQDPVQIVQDLGGADVVLEMSGSEKALNQGLEMIVPGEKWRS